MIKLVGSGLLRHRFLFLSFIVALYGISQALTGQWEGDFWEHSAVVRELATKLYDPGHPQLLVDAPHTFYSPYSVGIALFSRVVGLDPAKALAMAGVANLILLMISFNIFVSLFVRRDGVAFYALLLLLLFWGEAPWDYSGFFHLRVLARVLPYPSTFAASVTWIVLATCIRFVQSKNRVWLVAIWIGSALVLLTHPVTFIVLSVGMLAIIIGRCRLFSLESALLLCGLALALLVAAVWPYFPFFSFVLSASTVYHQSNDVMYVQVAKRIFPALIGLPLILSRAKSNWRDTLALMTLGLVLVYVYGAVSRNWSYGRVISQIVPLLHVAIADRVAQIESGLAREQSFLPKLVYSCLISLLLFSFAFNRAVLPAVQRLAAGQQNASDRYGFLASLTGQYDVVLSDMQTSLVVPTFGGKVVAVPHPLAFIPDYGVRKKDVKYFFTDVALHDARLEIIKRYGVDFVLLAKARVPGWQAVTDAFQPSGRVLFSDDEFVLIDLHALNQNGIGASRWLLDYPLSELPQRPQVARFGDGIELLGYELDTGDVPGGTIRAILYWHALRSVDAGYTVFVHLVDSEGEIRGQWDGQPLGGAYPTDVWSTSVVVREEYAVPVASDAPLGAYQVAVGFYRLATMERLAAFDQAGMALADGEVVLDLMVVLTD